MEVGLCCVLTCIMLCWLQRRLLAALLSCSMRSACTAWHGMHTQRAAVLQPAQSAVTASVLRYVHTVLACRKRWRSGLWTPRQAGLTTVQ